MHRHMSLRERFTDLIGDDEPSFEGSADPTLVDFAGLFLASGLFALEADKHLRTGALSPVYDCSTSTLRTPDSAPDIFVVAWAPVWAADRPVSGFRTGGDSAFVGSTPTVVMPADERTDALLLLVTSNFVHLSATRAGGSPLVQGAVDTDGEFRFVSLSPSSVPAATIES